MNYITEIKAFYDLLETNPLPSPAIAVWHALMHIANKTGWQQEFAVAVSVLEVKTGLNAKAIERARNKLSQAGLIAWKKRGGNQSALYTMYSLCDKLTHENVAQSVAQSVPQPVVQCVAQSVAINKHKRNKTNSKSSAAHFSKPTPDEVAAYCRERGNGIDPQHFYDYQEARNWVLSNGKKMADWRATIRTWERNNFKPNPQKQNKSAQTGRESSLDMEKIHRMLHGGGE